MAGQIVFMENTTIEGYKNTRRLGDKETRGQED